MTDSDDVAHRAARDVARMLDRRGLREVVALARRVRSEGVRAERYGAEPAAGSRCPRSEWLYPPTA